MRSKFFAFAVLYMFLFFQRMPIRVCISALLEAVTVAKFLVRPAAALGYFSHNGKTTMPSVAPQSNGYI